MAERRGWAPETLAAHTLAGVDATSGAIVPGIAPSTTYQRDADNNYRRGAI